MCRRGVCRDILSVVEVCAGDILCVVEVCRGYIVCRRGVKGTY